MERPLWYQGRERPLDTKGKYKHRGKDGDIWLYQNENLINWKMKLSNKVKQKKGPLCGRKYFPGA